MTVSIMKYTQYSFNEFLLHTFFFSNIIQYKIIS
jgi:hypothetical protein